MAQLAANKIRYYRWRGVNQGGKKITGVTLGFQEQEVRAQLTEQMIQVKKIKRTNPSTLDKIRNQMKSSDVTAITRQLATMIESGVPIVQALKLMASSHHKAEVRAVLTQVNTQVEAGASLSKALKSSSPLFDNFYCDLVATGEETGYLGQVFVRLATYREKSEAMRKKVIKAMIYPSMVMLTAISVTILMLVFVIPQFAAIFGSFGAELPWFTRQVLKASDFLINYGGYLAVGLLLVLVLYRYSYKRSYSFRLRMARLSLRLPIIGNVVLKATIARFARTLATTFSAGIPLLTGLQSAGKTAGNLHIEEAIMEAHTSAAAGMPLYLSLRQCNVFPELMLQMTMIGEESSSLDDMLNKMASLYENDVDNIVDNLGQILEPLIIIVLGVLIGGLLVAMYMPIFTLMSVIG
ncbi:Type II secretion system protein F [Photobacterium damselae subsp. piscicida]|uniref:Type II secretion system F family protein n=1 Tax=Photobacterium damsela subsp. piscicida TaxID=38294 RepID=A0A1V1V5W5_PHODP|nr:type II secretion system F family protein [Photobacterium damselae]MBE8128326.1 type II secretion system F family protein [Photobacterium damselae subsp. piscicida]MDP2568838.1 type II secretion system F family protein [Photobacterium damselae subsp. piscicida]PSV65593.1 type II secretion system F family protein [Photobacterium damselae]PSW76625.1 type II secretion system F family protein [Photobacterium damselae]QOD53040.1 type II secretion system F family protein [Photobacterium damselae 